MQDTVTNHCQRPRPGVTAGERHLEGTAALHQAELQPSSLTGSMHVGTEDTLALVHMHTRLRTPSLAAWWGNAEIFFFFPLGYFGLGGGQEGSSELASEICSNFFRGHAAVSVALEVGIWEPGMTTLWTLPGPSERRSSTQSEIPPIDSSFRCRLTFTIGKGIQLATFLLRGHNGDHHSTVSLSSAFVLWPYYGNLQIQ